MHILKTQLVSMYHQLYFLPPLSCFHAHLLALSHIYIYNMAAWIYYIMVLNKKRVLSKGWPSNRSGFPFLVWYTQSDCFPLSLFLTGWMFVRPNILRTLRQTMIRFLIELLVCRIWFGQSKLYFILNWLVMRCKLRPKLAADAQQTAWS